MFCACVCLCMCMFCACACVCLCMCMFVLHTWALSTSKAVTVIIYAVGIDSHYSLPCPFTLITPIIRPCNTYMQSDSAGVCIPSVRGTFFPSSRTPVHHLKHSLALIAIPCSVPQCLTSSFSILFWCTSGVTWQLGMLPPPASLVSLPVCTGATFTLTNTTPSVTAADSLPATVRTKQQHFSRGTRLHPNQLKPPKLLSGRSTV